MRDAFILLIYALLWYPKMAAQQLPASIEGTTVNSVSGAPLSQVHVRLALENPDEVVAPVYGAQSDNTGRFSIAGIRPGVSYRIEADRPGFLLYLTVEQTATHTFRAGERISGYKLELAPRAVVTGRVLDPSGEPIPHIPVMAQRVPPATPSRYSGHVAFTATDDRGVYRLSVVPDRYYITAQTQSDSEGISEIRTDGSEERHYLRTFYPSALTRESATPVELRGGASASGVDIHLVPSVILHISGTVSGLPPGARDARVVLQENSLMLDRIADAAADGAFSFSRLEPGNYRVWAHATANDSPLRSPILELKLVNSSMEYVSVPVSRGFDLRGRIDGASGPDLLIELMTVRGPDDHLGLQQRGRSGVAVDGSFSIRGIQPDQYEVQVRSLPENAYVKSLRLGTTEVEDGVVDLRSLAAGMQLAITVSRAGAQVTGSLFAANDTPMLRAGFVYLHPDGKDLSPRHRFATAEADGDGAFTVKGLPPGKYRIFANVNGVSPPGTLEQRIASAELIEIREGEKIVKNVKVSGAK